MEKRIIQVEEKVPAKMLIPLSIQHMFAMFGASVLVPFLFRYQSGYCASDEWCGNTPFYFHHKRKGTGLFGLQFCLPFTGSSGDQQVWI